MEKLPVIDGETGGDIYGYARTARGAKIVAGRAYVDGVAYAYRSPGPITLRDNTVIGDAWVAVSDADPAMEGPPPEREWVTDPTLGGRLIR